MRTATVERITKETAIRLIMDLDGQGSFCGSCGLGFFDHMLLLFCRHSLIDLTLDMKGDLQVDGHHSIEDLGLAMGGALASALGDKAGLCRYGSVILPMDEALIMTAVDLSGRAYLAADLDIPSPMIGDFASELLVEFLRAFVSAAGLTLHIRQLAGANSHHIIEGVFKSLARTLRVAASPDARETGVPSSKGVL
ncbi:MAG: imidazoleglycerol-phosphate dehydratase HisB [Clostridiales bacterium]|nr:imidazoleglycerol-phosphate dehydratase HisB [Clostridiales bacterium]